MPSVVALGVLMDRNNTVKQAGGFILQLMPFTEEAVIGALEKKLASLAPVTTLLEEGKSPEQILEEVLGDLGVEFTDRIPVSFYCNCSKERVEKVLTSLSREELKDLIDEGKDVELNCHFCNTDYTFSVEELKKLYR